MFRVVLPSALLASSADSTRSHCLEFHSHVHNLRHALDGAETHDQVVPAFTTTAKRPPTVIDGRGPSVLRPKFSACIRPGHAKSPASSNSPDSSHWQIGALAPWPMNPHQGST